MGLAVVAVLFGFETKPSINHLPWVENREQSNANGNMHVCWNVALTGTSQDLCNTWASWMWLCISMLKENKHTHTHNLLFYNRFAHFRS